MEKNKMVCLPKLGEINYDEQNDMYSFLCPYCGERIFLNEMNLCEHVVYVHAAGSDECFGLSDTFLEFIEALLEQGKADFPPKMNDFYRACVRLTRRESVRASEQYENRLRAATDYLFTLEELSIAEAAQILEQANYADLLERMRVFTISENTQTELSFLLCEEPAASLKKLADG